jgi:hypothetical protein
LLIETLTNGLFYNTSLALTSLTLQKAYPGICKSRNIDRIIFIERLKNCPGGGMEI